ncbi:MAG: galactokinase [Gemmatimonadaceae bacterium]
MSVHRVSELFALAYGYRPRAVASAPGRVNLIGEHTDYNGGAVLPIAIAQRTWVAIGSSGGGGEHGRLRSRAVSRERGEAGEWCAGDCRASGVWWDYVAGSLEQAHALGAARDGRDVAVVSDVPMGAGLSSSAALEVATVLAALAADRVEPPLRDVALAAHRAESEYVGVACGIMDQFASALCADGHALLLHCDSRVALDVPFPRTVLIVDTATPRSLRLSAYGTRRSECDAALAFLRSAEPSLASLAQATPELLERAHLPAPLDRRARHVVSETARVAAMVEALEARRPFGALLTTSHMSLRDDYECSTPELDWVVDRSVARAGVDGARLTGAGWGGCAIVVGEEAGLEMLGPELLQGFATAWGRDARVWRTTPHVGARIDLQG